MRTWRASPCAAGAAWWPAIASAWWARPATPPGRTCTSSCGSAERRSTLPVDSLHEVGERDRLPRGPVLAVLVALRRRGVGEHLVGHVQDLVDRLGRQRVGDLAERPQARVD